MSKDPARDEWKDAKRETDEKASGKNGCTAKIISILRGGKPR